MRNISRIIATALAFSALATASAADKALEQCTGCHGEGGVSTDGAVPSIAGLSSFVVEEYMLVFADGARPCRGDAFEEADGADHCAIAKALGEDTIMALAEALGSRAFVPAEQEIDAGKAAHGEALHMKACEKCHTDGGANPDDDASILAGQWMPYLERSFADFRSGAREQPKSMKTGIDALSDEDIEALVHYYARAR